MSDITQKKEDYKNNIRTENPEQTEEETDEICVLEAHPEANSVKDIIRTQNAKAANLPFKKRMEHFWTYYKVPFFVILGILIFAGYLVLHYTVFKPKPYAFSAYALNSFYVSEVTSSEEKPVDLFLADFCKKEQFDLTKTQAEINTDYAIDPEKAGNLDVALDLNLTATGLDGDVDILLGPSHLIDYYVPNGFYADTIDHYLPEDFYQYLLENDLIYYYTDDAGEKYAIGIYAGDAARMAETGLYPESLGINPVVAIVSSYSPRLDTASDFIEYLFDYPACMN